MSIFSFDDGVEYTAATLATASATVTKLIKIINLGSLTTFDATDFVLE